MAKFLKRGKDAQARAEADALGCVVSVHLNGDFLSPCTLTAIDGGRGMTEGLNQAKIDC